MSANPMIFPLSQIGNKLNVELGLTDEERATRRTNGASHCFTQHDLKTAWTSKTLSDYGLDDNEKRLAGQLAFERTGSTIRVTGKLSLQPQLECARCLATFRSAIEVAVDAYFLPQETANKSDVKGEVELSESDFNVYEYKKDQVTLEELLVDCIETAVPITPLCSEICAGLCTTCGRDLNDTTARCEHT